MIVNRWKSFADRENDELIGTVKIEMMKNEK